MVYRISEFIFFLLYKVLLNLKSVGWENVPRKGGVIIASNHVSNIDPPAVGIASKRRINFIAKEELFDNLFFGWWFKWVGAVPVKKNSADLSALKTAMNLLKQGSAIILFPEGTRSKDGSMGKPQPGVGFLAAKSDVPVIPAFVKGTEKAMPKGAKFLRLHNVTVYFGRPVEIDKNMPYEDIAEKIMDDIRRLGQKY